VTLSAHSDRVTPRCSKRSETSRLNRRKFLYFCYKSRERLKRRYLKDERISVISLSGLIQVVWVHQRSITFKIPWPFRIFFEMFARAQAGTALRPAAVQNQTGEIRQTFPFANSDIRSLNIDVENETVPPPGDGPVLIDSIILYFATKIKMTLGLRDQSFRLKIKSF
jgi:hypothetical protein